MFCRYYPLLLGEPSIEDVVTVLIVFVCSSHYVSNPHLTAKLIEVMFVVTPIVESNTDKFHDMLVNHPLAMNHLVPALMQLYTGKFGNFCLLLCFPSQFAPKCNKNNIERHSFYLFDFLKHFQNRTNRKVAEKYVCGIC